MSFRNLRGEAGEIDRAALRKWQEEVLRQDLAKFAPEDVYNADETGVFWKALPNKTLVFKGIFRDLIHMNFR